MKKILLILSLFVGFIANSQQIPGYTDINSRYRWLAGIFRALSLPAGSGPAALTSGQHTASGAIYLDTVGVDAGLYIYINGNWVLQGQGAAADLPDEFIVKPSVSWKGSGYQFHIQEGVYRIDNNIYASDSGSITLAASDPTDPRKDVIYVGTDGAFHVLQGTPAPAAAEPQLDGDQLKVTVIDVPAGSTVPSISQQIIYNENAEAWTETHTSVTVDPDNTTTPWIGLKNFNVTNINNGDLIYFTKTLGTVSMLDYTAFSIAVKLKAILPTTSNIRISFFASGIQVSTEVSLNLNKNSLVYQAISVPTAAFVFSNYNIDRVRVRYTNSAGATVHTGFYMDYIQLVAGISQPGGGGNFSATLVMPSGFSVSPSTITNNGTFTVTGAGSTSQYLDGKGELRTFNAWTTQGAIDGVAKTAYGFGVNGNIFHLQYADDDDPGIISAFNYRRLDSAANRSVINGDEDTLAVYVDAFTTMIMGLKDSTGIGIANRGTYYSIYATGGGGGGFFTSSTSTGNTTQDADGFDLQINNLGSLSFGGTVWNYSFNPAAGITHSMSMDGTGNWVLQSEDAGTFGRLNVYPGMILFDADLGLYYFSDVPDDLTATKVLVYNTTSDQMGTVDLAGLGGGGSGTVSAGSANRLAYYPGAGTTVDDLTAITANSLLASDANGLPVAVSGVSDTEAGYLNGVTSAIQTQIDSKVSSQWITDGSDIYYSTGSIIGKTTSTSGTGINANGVYNIRRTIAAAGNHRGFLDGTYFENTTGSTHSYAAFDVKDTISVGVGSTSDHQISYQARPLKVGAGTLTNMYNFGTATGKVDGGVVTNWYHYIAFNPTVSSGSITNQYGVYIPSLTAATNNYAAYFADNVGIGTATPAAKLHVAGTLRFVTGNEGANKMFVSDGSGNGDWVTTSTVKSNLSLNNVDNTSDATKNSATVTLTNKRITRRVFTTASSATPTPDIDSYDVYKLTALAADAVFGAPTGTPTDGQGLIIVIKSDATPRNLSFNAAFRASGDIPFPTITLASKTMYLGFVYNAQDSKYDLVSKIDNF